MRIVRIRRWSFCFHNWRKPDHEQHLLHHARRSITPTPSRTSGTSTPRSAPTRSPAITAWPAMTRSSSPAPTSTASRWSRRPRSRASSPAELADRDGGGLPEPVEGAGDHPRRLHPHHQRAPQKRRAGDRPDSWSPTATSTSAATRAGTTRGRRNSSPRPRPRRTTTSRRSTGQPLVRYAEPSYFFRLSEVRAAGAGAHPGQPGVHPAREPAQRGDQQAQGRRGGSVDQPGDAQVGHPAAATIRSTWSTSGSTP